MRPPKIGKALPLCLLLIVAALLSVSPGVTHAQGKSAAAPLSPELQAVKTALAKYSDPVAAVKDGYFSTLACIDFPKGAMDGTIEYPPGAMGVHFLNTANIGPTLDPSKPQVLLYEPVGNKLVLTGAEWFMPVQVAGDKAPTIFGQTLAGPMNGHEPIMPASLRHYDLHVWLWKNNPKGMFTSTNAAVKCPAGAPYTVAIGHDHH
ncbi:MAG: hypothetical protein ACM31F_02400 [Gemmatimonas sp.]